MMEHLTLYKPWWLTSSILLMLWLLYFLATAMLVIVSVYVAFWGDKMTLGRKASNQLLHRTTALG